jgi:hypothetical protein
LNVTAELVTVFILGEREYVIDAATRTIGLAAWKRRLLRMAVAYLVGVTQVPELRARH